MGVDRVAASNKWSAGCKLRQRHVLGSPTVRLEAVWPSLWQRRVDWLSVCYMHGWRLARCTAVAVSASGAAGARGWQSCPAQQERSLTRAARLQVMPCRRLARGSIAVVCGLLMLCWNEPKAISDGVVVR